jgi:hypothetical protein
LAKTLFSLVSESLAGPFNLSEPSGSETLNWLVPVGGFAFPESEKLNRILTARFQTHNLVFALYFSA